MNGFGKKIRELRGKKSLREASKNIGISHTYLDSLEKGYDFRTGKERKPTIEVINKISKYYNYDFFELAQLANVFVSLKDTPDEEKKDIIKKVKGGFENFKNESQSQLIDDYEDLFSTDLNIEELHFLKNSLYYLVSEKELNVSPSEYNNKLSPLDFMSSLLKFLADHRDSNNINAYKQTSNLFNKFLKQHLDIKGDTHDT
ncbi:MULTISPECIES: helix-turn-helix domain-containing protein [Staphylococcus]|uniref:helix-turn-helix domain-containing protein n=1 Tax=Staphylococcus TaxID=1279 RepID=UPI002885F483|nr:helix-turn-helix transcriptional regulator [Staphylococcus chromogenes]MDT0655125.1 helix-turn-helix transcriptional regulator [Staphylococcus chromogenes]